MRNLVIAIVTIVILSALFIWLPEPKQNNLAEEVTHRLLLKNMNVFDGAEWLDNVDLLLVNGSVNQVGTNLELKGNERVLESEGRFVIPGLIDAHTHTWGGALKQAATYGVTTELDMFTGKDFANPKQKIRDGFSNTQEADFYSAITLITAPGGHGTEYGMDIPTIDDPLDADSFVKARIDEGADYIKVVYDVHHRFYPSINKPILQAVIKAAHKYNKLAVVHTDNYQSALEAAQAGANGLVHGFFDQPVDQPLLDALKNSQTFVIPTTTVMASMLGMMDNKKLIDDFKHTKIKVEVAAAGLDGQFSTVKKYDSYQLALSNIGALHSAGITILAGTDAPNPGTAHGISIHLELALLVKAGLTPSEALKSATSNTAAQFKLEGRGCLQAGCRADFIVLNADPKQEIESTRTIEAVYKNGYEIELAPEVSQTDLKLPLDLGRFDSSLASEQGFDWQVTTDKMMGGDSIADLSLKANELLVDGKIGSGFPYPWSGVYMTLTADQSQPVLLPQSASIRFDMQGTPGKYRVLLFSPLSAMRPLSAEFSINESIQEVEIKLDQFSETLLSQITGLAIVAGKGHKEFVFSLDNIRIESSM
jgi:imidazolonepropionase-like amidohydrolase